MYLLYTNIPDSQLLLLKNVQNIDPTFFIQICRWHHWVNHNTPLKNAPKQSDFSSSPVRNPQAFSPTVITAGRSKNVPTQRQKFGPVMIEAEEQQNH